MQKLERTNVNAPNCLAEYKHGRDHWNEVSSEHKQQIRAQLEKMQGFRCAYCEGALDERNQHIEHFRSRALFQQLTFQWSNLYWSCNQLDSCGHYKDNKAGEYSSDDLIDPCFDDPDKFFRFRSDGTISVRTGLAEVDLRKAEETLRVFNLHPKFGRLRNMRQSAVSSYIHQVNNLPEMSKTDLRYLLEGELAATANLPFSTAIRHVLTEP
jgi:uncharacterized protein (TIGR02646 family)